jgi:hypothetical protein
VNDLPKTISTPDGPTVVGASPRLLSSLLGVLEAELIAAGVPVESAFLPGISAEFVRSDFASRNLVAPDEVVTWFGWHGGPTAARFASGALPYFPMRTLGSMWMEREGPQAHPLGYEESQFNPAWVKIIGQGRGVAVSCEGDPGETPLVRGIDFDGDPGTQPGQTRTQVVSLCTPVAWWIESIRSGWYRWYPELQRWDADPRLQPADRWAYNLS